jgi:hypothetical protein
MDSTASARASLTVCVSAPAHLDVSAVSRPSMWAGNVCSFSPPMTAMPNAADNAQNVGQSMPNSSEMSVATSMCSGSSVMSGSALKKTPSAEAYQSKIP